MKKSKCFLLIVCLLCLAGCIPQTQKTGRGLRYTAETYGGNIRTGSRNLHFRDTVLIKWNLWRADSYFPNGKAKGTDLFDGKDVVFFIKGGRAAVIHDKNTQPFVIKFTLNWKNTSRNKNYSVVNENANKNGFSCRLLKANDGSEICVDKKYDIAVYYKHFTKNSDVYNECIVKRMETAQMNDSLFKVPFGLIKIKSKDFDF